MRMTRANELTQKELDRADSHIRRGTTEAYDYAANTGQILRNVKETWWFRRELAEYLKD